MAKWRVFAVGFGCFVLGAAAQSVLSQGNRPSYSPDLYTGKDPKAAAAALLEGALELAGSGSWERIAVGRAWYLGGDKAKGAEILESVTSSRKVEGSDWFRVGRVYVEAGEWDKAQQAFDRALEADPGDDTRRIEYGGYANLHDDRAKAEELFGKAFARSGRQFWHWVNAGGSYLGVRPE